MISGYPHFRKPPMKWKCTSKWPQLDTEEFSGWGPNKLEAPPRNHLRKINRTGIFSSEWEKFNGVASLWFVLKIMIYRYIIQCRHIYINILCISKYTCYTLLHMHMYIYNYMYNFSLDRCGPSGNHVFFGDTHDHQKNDDVMGFEWGK